MSFDRVMVDEADGPRILTALQYANLTPVEQCRLVVDKRARFFRAQQQIRLSEAIGSPQSSR